MTLDRDSVRERLAELGWSQSRLAREVNLSLMMVNSFLNGKRRLSPASSARIATVLAKGDEEKRLIRLADEILAAAKESPALLEKLEELLRFQTQSAPKQMR